MDILDPVKTTTEIASQLGVLDAVKKKLASQPDVAASKLAGALEELQKTILAFEAEVVPFLAIILEPGPDYRRDVGFLYARWKEAPPGPRRVRRVDTAARSAISTTNISIHGSSGSPSWTIRRKRRWSNYSMNCGTLTTPWSA